MKKFSTILGSRNESVLIQWLLLKEFEDLPLCEIAKKLESYSDEEDRLFYNELLKMFFGSTARRYLVLTVVDFNEGVSSAKNSSLT